MRGMQQVVVEKGTLKTCSGQIGKSFDTIPVCFNTANLVNSVQVQDTQLDEINERIYRTLQK